MKINWGQAMTYRRITKKELDIQINKNISSTLLYYSTGKKSK